MQSSESILYNLRKNAEREGYTYSRLYRILYNPDIYRTVFKDLKEKSRELESRELDPALLEKLIDSLKTESYQPVRIKPGGRLEESELEKLGEYPRLYHRLVSGALAKILEEIFPVGPGVYGYQSDESPHLALLDVLNDYRECQWLISIDLTEALTEVERSVIEGPLREKIDDERLIRLVNKFLRAGYGRDFLFNRTYSKTAVTGALCGALSNVLLTRFDKAVRDIVPNLHYTRYKTAILIGFDADYNEAVRIDKAIRESLGDYEGYSYTFRAAHKKTPFLGYQVRVFERRGKKLPEYLGEHYVELRIPHGTIERVILDKKMVVDIDAKRWKPVHRGSLLNLSDLEIISVYDRELRSFYEYYALAENVSRKLGQLHYVMEYSCLKTFANKYRTTLLKFKRAHLHGEDWGIAYETKRGTKIKRIYKGFKRRFRPVRDQRVDLIETNNRIWKTYRQKHRV